MLTLLFLLLFFGLLAAGMPIFLVLGMCAGILYIATGQPLIGAAQMVINKLNSTTLMALPLFVMAAAFMRSGGVAKALVDVATAWLGGLRVLVPPSLALILYGIVAEQSVPRLFLAGVLPGLLQAFVFAAWVLYDARRRNFPIEPSLPLADRLRVTAHAVPALAVPLVVTVGIYGGVVTVTEAAALSAAVALLVSLIFYRGFHWTQTLKVITDGIRSAGTIMLIVATALAFGHWMTESGIPNQLVNFVIGHGFATWQFLLIINGLLLLLGCFLEVTATLLLVLPILAPALKPLGVDPVHFSIIFHHNMEIGLVHPPVGLNLFVLSTISSAPIGEVIRGILPFLILLLIVLGIITYVPILTLWLPDAVFG